MPWIYLKQNYPLHLTLFCMVIHVQQIYILHYFMSCSPERPFVLLTVESVYIIYNAKEITVIKGEYVSTYLLPWFAWDFMRYNFVFGLCLLELQACVVSFYYLSTSSFMLTQCRFLCQTSFLFIPIWLLWSYYNGFHCNWASTLIHLLFIATLPIIMI